VTNPTAILFDAGGVILYPDPDLILPPLNDAGHFPTLDQLIRAHYYAMRATENDTERDWWSGYLKQYLIGAGLPEESAAELSQSMARTIYGFAWTYANPVARDTLAALQQRGTPIGIVSNADGNVQQALCDLGVCHVPGTPDDECVTVGTVIDSTVVGVAKPKPEIFGFALDDMRLEAGDSIFYVGDTLRYDVRGALNAGLTPVHLDPFGDCSAPDGHLHIQSLQDVLAL
jgi:putative hydrolase of the HAD superfamily